MKTSFFYTAALILFTFFTLSFRTLNLGNDKNNELKSFEEFEEKFSSEFEITEKSKEENSSVLYSISPNCNRIKGKSWRCCGRVTITHDGNLRTTITTSSNRWQGFTGALVLVFYDENNQALFEIQSPSYGVNGESSRTDVWNYNFDAWETKVLNATSYASAYGTHTPSNRTGELVVRRSLESVKSYLASKGIEF